MNMKLGFCTTEPSDRDTVCLFQETADEGQGGADIDNNSVVTLTSTSSTTAPQQPSQQQHQQPPPVVHSPPSNTSNPLTVKDLMLGVIEMQLKRTPNSPADAGSSVSTNSSTPTISSILKGDHRNDITFVRGYKPSSSMTNTALSSRGDSNLATLSVVPHHSHRSGPTPQQISKSNYNIVLCVFTYYIILIIVYVYVHI